MEPVKPVFLKSYGKQKHRKILAWISPESHKKAFDSSDSEDSLFDDHKPIDIRRKKISVARPPVKPPKRKRAPVKNLDISTDEEGLPPSSEHVKKTRFPPLSLDCFVTRRRRLALAKRPVLDCFDEFVFRKGSLENNNVHRPAKKKRKAPSLLTDSSVEIASTNTIGVFKRPFQEISLNVTNDQSLGSCTKKPIFCSTPSASVFSTLSRPEPFSTLENHSINLQRPFGGNLGSPPLTPSLQTEENLGQDNHHQTSNQDDDNPSDRFEAPSVAKISSSELEKRQIEDAKKSGQSLDLSMADSDNSRFLSAEDGLDWLTYHLKEQCLTKTCSVQLERIELGLVSTYSSCLEYSSPIILNHSSQPSCDTKLLFDSTMSTTEDEASHYVKSLVYVETCKDGGSRIRCETGNTVITVNSSIDDVKESLLAESPNCSGNINAQSQVNMDVTPPIEDGRIKSCTVKLQQLDLSLLKRSLAKLSHVHNYSCEEKLNTVDLTEAGNSTTGEDETDQANVGTVKRKDCIESRIESLVDDLKKRCLSDNAAVKLERASLSHLQEMLRRRVSSTEDSEDVEEETRSGRVGLRKRSSAIPVGDHHFAAKRKKASIHPKKLNRGNTSVNRSGMSRKAGISGMSVSRWKNTGKRTLQKDGAKALDNSVVELISKQRKQTLDLFKPEVGFLTPVRAGCLILSPGSHPPYDTQTWSQLKAALSVHRKVLCTPGGLRNPIPCSPDQRRLLDFSRDLFATPFRTPLPKHLRSQLQSNESLTEDDLSDAEKVIAECKQQRHLRWEECILPEQMKKVVKIGEGTFGEVFSTMDASGEKVALKVIPVEGIEKVNNEDQKTFGEILHEMIISKELSSLKDKQQNQTHGFIGLHNLHCVQGCYPAQFLKAWDAFHRKKGSENDRPDFFGKDQIFIILQFEFGGTDLENSNGKLMSLNMAKSILHQVTAALAVAEQELRFEHRDLHWGNVLVKTTKQKSERFLINGATHTLETRGVLVRIIDYSLSRMEIDGLTVSCDISNDEELFKGWGDYQFDIYRMMRQENGNDWSVYHPHTNVLWLHYLCTKLLTMQYRTSGGRVTKDARALLTQFQEDVLQYTSATEVLKAFP